VCACGSQPTDAFIASPSPRPQHATKTNKQPATVTVKAGEAVTWVNNAGFPHNIVFDEDAVPDGVNAEAISREDYLNAPGETFKVTFDKAGTYGYYCEPHQGAGMVGKVVVQ
jgi:plastocyanin